MARGNPDPAQTSPDEIVDELEVLLTRLSGNIDELVDRVKPANVAKRQVQRVYLLTGENDGVAEKTVRVGETLKKVKVPVKVKLVPGMGHEVPSDRMVSTYRRPLAWLMK